jgi:hypothetical protein
MSDAELDVEIQKLREELDYHKPIDLKTKLECYRKLKDLYKEEHGKPYPESLSQGYMTEDEIAKGFSRAL